MNYPHRYDRNLKTFTPEENQRLKTFNVCVVGCGGLGGYVIEMLGRLGIGRITALDCKTFDETNLNRHLLAEEDLMGTSRAQAAKARMTKVNSEVTITCVEECISQENCSRLIRGHDLIIEALDNMSIRKIIEKSCEEEKIPFIHGAVAGWFGQVATIYPGDKLLDKIYPCSTDKGAEIELGIPAFTPALVASIEVAEAVKVLLKKGVPLRSRMLTIDLLMQEYECFDF